MNKLQELEQQLKEQQSKLTYLQAEIEKLKQAEQNGNQWVPGVKEEYWLISTTDVEFDFWQDDEYDRFRLSVGNVYRTEEEAEFEAERLKVIVELKQYTREFVHGRDNWHVCYNFNHDYISYDYERVIKRTTLYFDSENIVRQAVQAVGEDRVKKYYLGVE